MLLCFHVALEKIAKGFFSLFVGLWNSFFCLAFVAMETLIILLTDLSLFPISSYMHGSFLT